jgi:hypothetical protein
LKKKGKKGGEKDADVAVTNTILLQILVIQLLILTLSNIRKIQDKYAEDDSAFSLYLGLLKMCSDKLRKQKLTIQ